MNEQANKILAELLQKASDGIDAAVSFSQAQIPDVVHQLLLWNFTRSMVLSMLCLISIPFAVWFLKKQFTRKKIGELVKYGEKKERYQWTLVFDSEGDASPAIMILAFFGLLYVSFVGSVLLNMTWLKIWLAPKLYLIEYAASLVK
ncbi:TPA: hypothetical protein ACXJAC_002652 [Serratia marcescens]|uniref:hypothetical protein n=1 Tax=Serratia marcescens TaxID=615 RepID=UPI000B600A36|nr:hypothetical protein [Serratia marcescens]ASM15097.1 hypothetical protein BVG93_15900 [Serratia marcescens]